jgi:hypothetical protein
MNKSVSVTCIYSPRNLIFYKFKEIQSMDALSHHNLKYESCDFAVTVYEKIHCTRAVTYLTSLHK